MCIRDRVRITQHRRRGLRLVLFAVYFDFVRRGIVLHLHPRFEVILARRHDRRLPDPLPPAESRERRIRQHRAARRQFLMDSHQIPLAGSQQIQDLLAVRLSLIHI